MAEGVKDQGNYMAVDAWLFRTDNTENERRVAVFLSAEERARADAFRFERDRTRFVNSHGIMREILGSYLQVDAASVMIVQAENGKPHLGAQYRTGVYFNLSHAGQYAIVAVSIGRPVGVDVEAVRANFAWPQLADRYFSTRENAWLRAYPPDEAVRWFYRLWVAKEAVLKASGAGLSATLRDVEPPRGEHGSIAVPGGFFWVSELAVPDGYVAALAVSGGEAATLRQAGLTSAHRATAPVSLD